MLDRSPTLNIRSLRLQLLTLGVTFDVLLCEHHRPIRTNRPEYSHFRSGSRLGNLGGHTQFDADGALLQKNTFILFGKVRLSDYSCGETKNSMLTPNRQYLRWKFWSGRVLVSPRSASCFSTSGFSPVNAFE